MLEEETISEVIRDSFVVPIVVTCDGVVIICVELGTLKTITICCI